MLKHSVQSPISNLHSPFSILRRMLGFFLFSVKNMTTSALPGQRTNNGRESEKSRKSSNFLSLASLTVLTFLGTALIDQMIFLHSNNSEFRG